MPRAATPALADRWRIAMDARWAAVHPTARARVERCLAVLGDRADAAVLFGSAARPGWSPARDVDLLVVVPDTAGMNARRLREDGLPLEDALCADVHVRRAEDLDPVADLCVLDALQHGVVARGHARILAAQLRLRAVPTTVLALQIVHAESFAQAARRVASFPEAAREMRRIALRTRRQVTGVLLHGRTVPNRRGGRVLPTAHLRRLLAVHAETVPVAIPTALGDADAGRDARDDRPPDGDR
jgi:predicted nucleotidyltransferase